jgi:methionyl-tRNA formyltransferase
MRIVVLTQDDPLYILPFFEEFLTSYADSFQIVGLFCSRAMGKRPRTQLARELLSLYGFFGAAKVAVRMAQHKLLGTSAKPRDAKPYWSIAQLCAAYNVPFELINNPNDAAFVEKVRALAPDVIMSVACPFILKAPILELPPRGCVNIHHAPLPRYKGMMPTFWQMFHGERSVGLTIHYMVPKVDEGAILATSQMEIEPNETLDHLIRRSKRHGAHEMAKVMRQFIAGKPPASPMTAEGSTYFTFPNREQIREFHRKGLRAI